MNTLVLSLVLASPAQTPTKVEIPSQEISPKKSEPLPSDILTASMLLDSSTPVPDYGDYWTKIRDAILFVSVDREIMDPRECRYFMTTIEEFEKDLSFLRNRNEILRHAPKLWEANRLPERRIINELISFNRDFKKHLEERLIWENDRADVITIAIKDCEKCYRVWDAIRDARSDFQYVSFRRLALLKLKGMIGDEDFMIGNMPEYVPEWAFIKR